MQTAATSERAPSPARLAILLILATLAIRLIAGAITGLGIDESYMVAVGRKLQIGYFDHPPLAWWISWGAAHLFGTEAAWAVRLPFELMFAASTWALYRLTEDLFGARAGLWAVLLLNLAPVLGVTTATWVLPDGPLILALLGAAICLRRAIEGAAKGAWGWWLGAGGCAGLALLSKYSAGLVIGGAILFLLTTPARRGWLARPQPYLAGVVALLLFSPVIVWNLDHGWASFAFQGGRATGAEWHPARPFVTLAGEALYLLPWIWVLLIGVMVSAFRRGPGEERRWLMAWLGVIPVILFALVSAWSPHRVFFHWAAPGYLMLMPLAGDWLARHPKARWLRRLAIATAALVISLLVVFVAELRFNIGADLMGDAWARAHPASDAVDWTDLRTELENRSQLDGRQFVAATRWLNAGKIDYALGGAAEVVCLNPDARQYGIVHPLASVAGRDGIILDPKLTLDEIRAQYGAEFADIEPMKPIFIRHAGRPMMVLHPFLGHGFRPPPP